MNNITKSRVDKEVRKYNKLKKDIRKKIKSQLTDFERKILSYYRYKKGID